MAAEFSIIIPVFNQASYTQSCLQALTQDPFTVQNAEILIVDNGSTDDTQSVIQDFTDKLHIQNIQFDRSLGFSTACNEGAQRATTNKYIFLNNDTEPLLHWLECLNNTLSVHKVGIVGPQLINSDRETINHAGYVRNHNLGGFYNLYSNYPIGFAGVNRRRYFQALLGACILLKKDLFEAIGGFAPYGLEDIDLCLKAREMGLLIAYEPRSKVIHHGSITLTKSIPGSFPETDALGFNNRWPAHLLLDDDEVYYREDGLAIQSIIGFDISLRAVIDESNALRIQGLELLKSRDMRGAIEKLKQAIQTFTGNKPAYEDLFSVYVEHRNTLEAVKILTQMTTAMTEEYEARVLLAKLHHDLGNVEESRSLIQSLITDWTVPDSIRQEAQELYSD